ncbi:thiol-disulfide isomerase/thioredoxin [Pseudochelatococcus lubricantis]|uniref:Thiol-disulfide isomerase/thioredoxin n=1 Tax=Pseudochelatococcus lubricantis TaxID=1538102 RepID=A0ABX0V1I5_9HYPH|nr:TlpA disulfide reductase family protein [Pseudochelatococcus lubricantis]NIJ59011.1 thiol-disulfide isomerase/thioredoxin [Pseudochelatococcus lubricantis]
MKRRMAWLSAFAMAALLVGCKAEQEIARGKPVAEIAAITFDGTLVKLEHFRGKVVLLNFWSGGCGPCIAEMPALDAVYRANRDRGSGFTVLALNMGEPDAAVQRAAARLGVSFPVLLDGLKITTDRYQVVGAPTSFLIDGEGRLIEKIVGPVDIAGLEAKLAGLL